MKITEESLFEIVEDLQGCSWGQNEGVPIPMKLSDWRRVAHEQAADVEGIEEDFNIDINEAFLQSSPIKVLENIEMIWNVKFSKPGEVEKKQGILRLSKNAYKDNKIKSFKEQIEDYRLGKTSSGELLVVEDNPNRWGIEGVDFENKFVVIKQSFINKILEDHEIDFDLLVDVSNLIQKRVLSFESISYPNSRVIILDAKDKFDRDILIALHLDIEKNKIQVSELSSVYGKKELGYLLENTINLNKSIEVTEKTNKWLLSNGVPFPALVTTYLHNEYNKKFGKCQVEDYKNPKHDVINCYKKASFVKTSQPINKKGGR